MKRLTCLALGLILSLSCHSASRMVEFGKNDDIPEHRKWTVVILDSAVAAIERPRKEGFYLGPKTSMFGMPGSHARPVLPTPALQLDKDKVLEQLKLSVRVLFSRWRLEVRFLTEAEFKKEGIVQGRSYIELSDKHKNPKVARYAMGKAQIDPLDLEANLLLAKDGRGAWVEGIVEATRRAWKSKAPTSEAVGLQLASTICHEIGHSLGLHHVRVYSRCPWIMAEGQYSDMGPANIAFWRYDVIVYLDHVLGVRAGHPRLEDVIKGTTRIGKKAGSKCPCGQH